MSKVRRALDQTNGSVDREEMAVTDEGRVNSGTTMGTTPISSSVSKSTNGSNSITNSLELGSSVSYSVKSKKMAIDIVSSAPNIDPVATQTSTGDMPTSKECMPLSHCKHNSHDNMSNLEENAENPSGDSPDKEAPPPASGLTPADGPTDFAESSGSRESSPEAQSRPMTPGSRSNNHSSGESRSSEPDPGSKRPSIGRPVNVDFEKMKVSLILRGDEYDDDDLCITSVRPSSTEVPHPSPRNTPPTTLPNVAENGTDTTPEWTRSGEHSREFAYSGIGFREGRRTPTNGQLSDSSAGRLSFESTSPTGNSRSGVKSGTDKKKKPYWYNAGLVLSPTYKSRSEDFKRLFKDIPGDERLIVDYSCALQKDILVHGRIYITQNWICFYANIFRWETVVMMRCKEIVSMTKEKTARVIPNAIQICTKEEKYFFTSFGTRDKTYLMLFRVWQNALTDNPMTSHELWQWVRYSYGEELGLNSSDEDYVQASTEDELHFNTRILQDEKIEAVGLEDIKDMEDEELLAEPLLQRQSDGDHDGQAGEPHRLSPRHGNKPAIDIDGPDVPTDESDTSDTEENEVLCTDHDHLTISVIEDVYNFNVDKLFEMVFTDSQIYRQFTEVKKTTELVQSQWSEEVDSEGDRHRSISYTLSLNYSIGPKTSPAKEKQVLRATSKPGLFYLVDTECINGSIPYGDNFYVINRYCMARVSGTKCRFKITSAIKYRKSVWGVVKSFIEKNVQNGINDSFNCMADLLRQESNRIGQQSILAPLPGKKKVLRRRRQVSDRSQSVKRPTTETHSPGHTQITPVKNHPTVKSMKTAKGVSTVPKEDLQQRITSDTLVKVICAILVTLVVFNALLFYKLWSLEQKATLFYNTQDLWTNPQAQPESPEEWMRLLQQQQVLHSVEIDRWKEVLSSSVKLMQSMQKSLGALQDGINARHAATHDEH